MLEWKIKWQNQETLGQMTLSQKKVESPINLNKYIVKLEM